MKKTITEGQFIDAFDDYGRGDNFSYEGRRKLFEWFTELEEGTGEEIELDVIAICCDWGEYEDEKELLEEYEAKDIEELKDETTVIELDNGGYLIRLY